MAANQSLGGYQFLPNDHIYNTDISGLSAASNSATIMAAVGTVPVNFLNEFPYNYGNNSTATDTMSFENTAANNGTFAFPQWPLVNIEGGWFDARVCAAPDHHILTINTQTGALNEIYQYCPTGTIGPGLNSVSGVKYTYSDYALAANGTSDAGGTFLTPLLIRSSEFLNAVTNSVAIKHALRVTLANGYICGSSTANSCPVGSQTNAGGTRHIWPATSEAFNGGGIVPYGACFRLKSAFNISGFSAAAQIILTEMQHYCTFLDDGGSNWTVSVDWDNMPAAEVTALAAIQSANIATSNWEAVDTSSLMEVATSGASSNGEVVTYTASTGSAKTNVDLQGTAINVAPNNNLIYVMAGAAQFQLPVFSNGAFTCAMSPTVGSITSGGLYTAPASVTVGTHSDTTVTCTSSVVASVKAEMLVRVFPLTNFNITQDTADFTDSHGKVWFAGGQYGFGMSNVPQLQGCCQNDSSIGGTDKQLFWNRLFSSLTQEDYKIDFHVPNGLYTVTFNNGTTLAVGTDVRYFYVQGALAATEDTTATCGLNAQCSLTESATVSTGVLSFYNAGIGNQTNNSGDISSISITQQTPVVPSAPVKLGGLLMAGKR